MSEGANPILDLLDARGIPWRESQNHLIRRFGTVRSEWASSIDVIRIAGSEHFLPGLLRPLQHQLLSKADRSLPALDYVGGIWLGDDAKANLAVARDALAPSLGSPVPYDTSNTRGFRWAFGRTRLSLTCWPEELKTSSYNNVRHRQDPRTISECSIVIRTGFCPSLASHEQAALATLQAFPAPADARPANGEDQQYALEYIRSLPGDGVLRPGPIGKSADLLVAVQEKRLLIVPRAALAEVVNLRVQPARGRGYARIQLHCRATWDRKLIKTVDLLLHDKANGLDQTAEDLAAWLDLPLAVEHGIDD